MDGKQLTTPNKLHLHRQAILRFSQASNTPPVTDEIAENIERIINSTPHDQVEDKVKNSNHGGPSPQT